MAGLTEREISLDTLPNAIIQELMSLDNWAVSAIQVMALSGGVDEMIADMAFNAGAPEVLAMIVGQGAVLMVASVVGGAAVRVMRGQMALSG